MSGLFYFLINSFTKYNKLIDLTINKKFNIDSNADIYKELKNKNVDEETIKNIKDIIDSCQFELYSGNSINKNEDYHTKAINILKETDKLK